jgi:hypothetical protein
MRHSDPGGGANRPTTRWWLVGLLLLIGIVALAKVLAL